MKIDAVKWGGVLLIILALMAGSAWAAWEWQANAFGQRLAAKEAAHQTERTDLANANSAQILAEQVKRLAQDELTLTRHQRLDAAYKRGFFDDLISPHRGLARDNNLRADASLEKLAGLSPAYDRQNGTLTAGNSTPLTDGASVVLLASEEWAAAHGWPSRGQTRSPRVC